MVNFADAPGDLSRRRPELDHRQGLRRSGTRSPARSPATSSTATATTPSTSPGASSTSPTSGACSGGPTGTSCSGSTTTRPTRSCGPSRTAGYDSNKVFIGGLELGGIFGTNLKLQRVPRPLLAPRPTAKGALPLNAAVADRRLDGKRSRRVEALCRAHDGKGSPCDFVSIHAYNRSELMAAKLIRAKEMALEIDPEYYRDALGQLARVLPRLDAAARRGGGRRLPGQRLLPDLVRRRRAPPAPPGRERSRATPSARRS